MSRCSVPCSILTNGTLSALQCSSSNSAYGCSAICPNTDLAGLGVRAAFYGQSVLNTLLVVFSPRDAVASAWASTLLTGGLVIAAIVQKINTNITLHHALLTLNFATISCISSLAVAPLLPIWCLRPSDYYARELARNAISGPNTLHGDADGNVLVSEVYVNTHKKKIKAEQNKERLILSLALLTQVVLQWAWGIILFVSPAYNQTCINANTILVFFLKPITAKEINDTTFVIWPLWLIFSLGITMILTIVLAISGHSRAHIYSSRRIFRYSV
ncbi:hypothetical protein SCP_0706650 [Sparassis crispa]|uniref:Uncharacterized protein n=1 Tax=Sparassis crispa TaxID=139825 RepID=A0A401GTC3_9APHY|nr:hypothetical protein SCP_0706650 [Sparassis crispa]GBE85478.1 hypothetical protein SCP_0706650 [Sparassis crispa]